MRPGAHFTRKAEGVTAAHVEWLSLPPFSNQRLSKLKAAKAAGIRYERKIQAKMEAEYPLFLAHPCMRFHGRFGSELCIPDGIVISEQRPDLLTIVEIKLRHTSDAWYQLHDLYLPVAKKAFPSHTIQLLEICKFYDPAIKLPRPIVPLENVRRYICEGGEPFAVYPRAGT
jgi:hypothetical protein